MHAHIYTSIAETCQLITYFINCTIAYDNHSNHTLSIYMQQSWVKYLKL